MHIPHTETKNIPILSFEEALAIGKGEGYDPAKWLYVPDFYTEYRYVLGLRGERPLICIGVNPSTAAPDDLDNTLKSVNRIATANGYQGFLMLNVYPQRATRPDDMERQRNEILHRENREAFRHLLAMAGEHPAVWAAWGAIVEKRDYLLPCVADLAGVAAEAGAEWLCAGKLSKAGHPHHPLYLKKDEPLRPFDLAGYLQAFGLAIPEEPKSDRVG